MSFFIARSCTFSTTLFSGLSLKKSAVSFFILMVLVCVLLLLIPSLTPLQAHLLVSVVRYSFFRRGLPALSCLQTPYAALVCLLHRPAFLSPLRRLHLPYPCTRTSSPMSPDLFGLSLSLNLLSAYLTPPIFAFHPLGIESLRQHVYLCV